MRCGELATGVRRPSREVPEGRQYVRNEMVILTQSRRDGSMVDTGGFFLFRAKEDQHPEVNNISRGIWGRAPWLTNCRAYSTQPEQGLVQSSVK